jgi:predicted TIM-barrel fold metal-dependent hydrolase
MGVLSAIVFGGVLERYPNVRVVIGESGIGWLPYALERLDYEWEDQFQDLIPKPPSEYWQRQMYATFQVDRTGLLNLAGIGEDTIMWGNDFPHPDGTWPDSREILAPQLEGLAPGVIRKIVCDNAARLYGFEVP